MDADLVEVEVWVMVDEDGDFEVGELVTRRTDMPTQLTCGQLLDCDPTFASAIAMWVAEKRCPLQLGDYLQELGLDAAADCARWCAEQPDRLWYVRERYTSGAFPGTDCEDTPHYWCAKSDGVISHANEVPKRNCPRHSPVWGDPEPVIVWLLDNWIPRS